jgi:hypothetical protein
MTRHAPRRRPGVADGSGSIGTKAERIHCCSSPKRIALQVSGLTVLAWEPGCEPIGSAFNLISRAKQCPW